MRPFKIKHVVPMFKTVMDDKGHPEQIQLDPYRVGRHEVRVDFDGVEETRHAILDRANKTWSICNSTLALRQREGILTAHDNHRSFVSAAKARVSDLDIEIAELKNKCGVAAKRKALRADLKTAKAAFAIANGDLTKVAAIAKGVDETHPEIVEFA